jgi:hypothetical protein
LLQNHGREYGGTSRNQMANPKVATKPRKWFLTYCSHASNNTLKLKEKKLDVKSPSIRKTKSIAKTHKSVEQ